MCWPDLKSQRVCWQEGPLGPGQDPSRHEGPNHTFVNGRKGQILIDFLRYTRHSACQGYKGMPEAHSMGPWVTGEK